MFGYVTVNRETLSQENETRFRAYYCGLCKALRKRHGLTGALTLSNDMTFLSIVLTSLYEPEEDSGREICFNHPVKKHGWVMTQATDYAADMNILLAYHLCMDNWRDDKKLISLAEASLIKNGYRRVREMYPEKCEFVGNMISALSDVESSAPNGDIDRPTNLTGELIGEIFAWKDDQWARPLTRLGAALGRFIYIMDAYDDLPGDIKKGRYNPLKPISGLEDYEDRCLDMLTMHISECTEEFEMLPMLRDAGIIRNILYSGVWNKYAYIQSRKEKEKKK